MRARLFAITFSLTLALGVGWTLLQPVAYRSEATVLMSPPSAIDATVEEANIQSVTIQSRILLGTAVTRQLLAALEDAGLHELDLHYLRQTLRVEAVPETNLVEMVAQGADANILPTLVNTWIDVYLDIRTQDIKKTQEQTLEVVQDQLAAMAQKLDEGRLALEAYRKEHRIVSAERQQNKELARLEGLNASLNSAVETEVAARANLESLRSAIAAGKNVVPPDERESVDDRKKELSRLRARMAKLDKLYTSNYIRNQPELREIPIRIAELESALDNDHKKGRSLVLATAEQEHAAALQSVEDFQQKLAVQEQAAGRFTTIYAKHEALADDLAELEAVHRQTQSRLLQVQVNQVEKYPQVSIIDRPDGISERLGPDYPLLLGVSFAAAIAAGVLSVWLYGFLGARPTKPSFVTLSGVHMYPPDTQHPLPYPEQEAQRLKQPDSRFLESSESAAASEERADSTDNGERKPGSEPPSGAGPKI